MASGTIAKNLTGEDFIITSYTVDNISIGGNGTGYAAWDNVAPSGYKFLCMKTTPYIGPASSGGANADNCLLRYTSSWTDNNGDHMDIVIRNIGSSTAKVQVVFRAVCVPA